MKLIVLYHEQVKNGKFSVATGTEIQGSETVTLSCNEGYRPTKRKFGCADVSNAPRCLRKKNSELCRCNTQVGRCVRGQQTVVSFLFPSSLQQLYFYQQGDKSIDRVAIFPQVNLKL